MLPNDCFIISAKCKECGKEAEVIYPNRKDRKVMLRCKDCGDEFLKIRYDKTGKIGNYKFGSCHMLGMFDSVIQTGKK